MGKKIIAILHSNFMIDIPLALPLRKSMIKSQSVDESSPRNAGKFSRLSADINSLVNSVDPDQLASEETS